MEETQQSADFIHATELPGVFTISRPVYEDPRGFFRETFRKHDLDARLGYSFDPVQANHSRSRKGTLRGIHIAPWHKLVTVLNGSVQQIVVDTRPDSPTFGQHISVELGEDNWNSVFIPAGCGNAFLVTSRNTDYMYLTTDYWAAGKEQYVIYNDPDVNIAWQINSPIVSDKDLQNPTLRSVYPDKFLTL